MLQRFVIGFLFIVAMIAVNPLGRYERSQIFRPTSEIVSVPTDKGLSFEDVFVTTEDGVRLHGWFVKASDQAPTLLFLHGNARNISHRLEKIAAFHAMGLNVLIIDYRGYGQSQGKPSEEGVYRDARAVYDYLLSRKDVDPKRIIGYGESLGGAIIIELAGHRALSALIVDSSFSSLPDMARILIPHYPRFLAQNRMDSISKVGRLVMPKLFLHSPEDQLVPFEMGRRLFEAASEPKAFAEIRGGHNRVFDSHSELFTGAVRSFLEHIDLL